MLISFISGCDINKININEFNNYMDYLVNFGLSNQLVSILARIYSNDDNVNPYWITPKSELPKRENKEEESIAESTTDSAVKPTTDTYSSGS